MEQLISLDWVTILSIILGVASIVLSIVSIVISLLFYRWSKEENEKVGNLSVTITEKVICLEKLFDKLYASTYDMVLENNRAMQRQLFPGSFGSPEHENKDMEVFNLIDSRKIITISEICSQLGVSFKVVEGSVNRMVQLGRALVDTDGNTVHLIDRIDESLDSSD